MKRKIDIRLAGMGLVLGAAVLAGAPDANAIPARGTVRKYVQPDGTTVMLKLHGDEFHHWYTIDGSPVSLSEDGFYRYIPTKAFTTSGENGRMKREIRDRQIAENAKKRRRSVRTKASSEDTPMLVILMQFSDLKFNSASTVDKFDDLLNGSGAGSHGSVRGYYSDNSDGAYNPSFDIYGPVTLSKGYAYYGADDENDSNNTDVNIFEALFEAVSLIDDQVDFSKYDTDGDGYVDNILFMYAGYSQAAGAGVDYIWPHFYDLRYSGMDEAGKTYDGKYLSCYEVMPELSGSSGEEFAGIGVVTHEFGHFLGLPDLYDTDYDENGDALTPGSYSLMDSGSYNDNSHTPPYLSLFERFLLDWVEWPQSLEEGTLSIGPVRDNEGYVIACSNEGEYFLFESRDLKGWDAYIPNEGLLIYHIDMSQNDVEGIAAGYRWNDGTLNNYASHPCYTLLVAADNGEEYFTYPGLRKVTSVTPEAWNGYDAGCSIENISFDSSTGTASFTARTLATYIAGTVTNLDGDKLQGVVISAGSYSCTSSSDGTFSMEVPAGTYNVTASCDGYTLYTNEGVKVSVGTTANDIIMLREGESLPVTLKKYTGSDYLAGNKGLSESDGTYSVMASVVWDADELSDHVGMYLESVSFYIYFSEVKAVYAMVYKGDEMVALKQVENPVGYPYSNTVNVRSSDVLIEEGQSLRLAYAVEGADDYYVMIVDNQTTNDASSYLAKFNLDSPSWERLELDGVYPNLNISGVLSSRTRRMMYSETVASPYDFNYILCENSTFYAGVDYSFSLALASGYEAKSISWSVDGNSFDPANATFKSGKHTVTASVEYTSGATEIIEYTITVNSR